MPDFLGSSKCTPEIAPCDNSAGSNTVEHSSARSYHPGGVNAVSMDGHVKFYSDEIDILIWQALASINGKEVISDGS